MSHPKIPLTLIYLQNASIYDQLILEETLLRTSSKNYALIQWGVSPAIVMGVSAKPEEWIDLEKAAKMQLPLIKRFSGGGTVVVDNNTLFVTLIINKNALSFTCFPSSILKWTELLYAPIFGPFFSLRENDYTYHNKKIGGNAQYIQKERFVHHTSFLWDYDPNRMQCLKHPIKQPVYRSQRSHEDFIHCLCQTFNSRDMLMTALSNQFTEYFNCDIAPLSSLELSKCLIQTERL